MKIWTLFFTLFCNLAFGQSNEQVLDYAFSNHPYIQERIKAVELSSAKSKRQSLKFSTYLKPGIEEEKQLMLAVMQDHPELFVDDNLIALCFNPWNAIDYKARYKEVNMQQGVFASFWNIASNESRRSRYSRIIDCFNGKKSGSLIDRHEKAIRNLGVFQRTGIKASEVSRRVQAFQAAFNKHPADLPQKIKADYMPADRKPFYSDKKPNPTSVELQLQSKSQP